MAKWIRRIQSERQEPRIEILAHGLPSAEAAFQVEAAAIDLLGIQNLANKVRGVHGRTFGRRPLAEAVAKYVRRKAHIRERAILVRINEAYHYGISEIELYDATRSAWKVGPRKDDAEYAFAVYESVIREVYRITGWHPAGTTFNTRFGGRRHSRSGRWEFVGTLAEDPIRKRYVNRYVGDLFKQGAQNPVAYANLG